MSGKKAEYPQAPPSAPAALPGEVFFQHRGPPPSYEESQRPDSRPPPPNYYTVNPPQGHPIQQNQHFNPYPQMNHAPYAGVYMPRTTFPNTMQNQATDYKVLEFDNGARFQGPGAGSITVPPPPPGYAATPAQLAAMQGHPVIVKKKKNSFF